MPTTIGEVRAAMADLPDDMPCIITVHRHCEGGGVQVNDYNLDAMELLVLTTKPRESGHFHFITNHKDFE